MTLIRSQSVVTAFACFAVTLVNGAAAAAQTPTHPPTPVARAPGADVHGALVRAR
jgi:hypothetical protein